MLLQQLEQEIANHPDLAGAGFRIAWISWEIGRNPLMRHARFNPQLGKKRSDINVGGRFLIPLFRSRLSYAPDSPKYRG
jgi:hypothetical protein